MNFTAAISIGFLLFIIGITIILIRKELLFILMGIEVMLNSACLIALTGAQYWHNPQGTVLTLIFMLIAGAELAVSLLIVMHCYRGYRINRLDQLGTLQD